MIDKFFLTNVENYVQNTSFLKSWNQYKNRVKQNCITVSESIDALQFWRNRLFATIMIHFPPLGLLLMIFSLNYVIPAGKIEFAILHIISVLTLIIIALKKRVNLKVRKISFFIILYSIACTLLFFYGHNGTSLTYFYAISIFAFLFISNRAGYLAVIFNGLIFSFYGFLIYLDLVNYSLKEDFQIISWMTISTNSLILSTITVLLLPLLFDGLQETILRIKKTQNELIQKEENLKDSLETLKKKSREINHSKVRYNTICKITNEIIWEWDLDQGRHKWNSGDKDYVTKSEVTNSINLNSWFEKIHPEDLIRVKNSFFKVIQSDTLSHWEEEYRFRKNDGHFAYVLDRGYLIRNENNKPTHFYGGMRNITHLKENELYIKKSLKEKEALLAEIHHRVKNNLASISAILNLQIYQEEDKLLAEKLTDSILRIKSIARIHEQLYESENFSSINLPEAVENLVTTIVQTMQFDTEVSLDFNVDKSIKLSMNTAVPCSLILNEIVTNILKHAFIKCKTGHISVNFKRNERDFVEMKIIDNGIGLSKNFPNDAQKNLGLELLSILSKQIKAEYKFESKNGKTIFVMEFLQK